MAEADELTVVARERAEKRIDEAIGRLHQAANDIGKELKIPEGIAGHSIDELLGRMAYVPSMARDLRRACAQECAKQELHDFMSGAAAPEPEKPAAAKPPAAAPKVEPSKIPGTVPVGMDVGDLDGISTQTIKALREGGLTKVGDVVGIPDEHLVKMNGLGEKSVAHLRAAISKAAGGE